MNKLVRVGVIGYGYWGPNLVRNFSEVADCRVVAIADQRPARLNLARARWSSAQAVGEAADVVTNPDVDAVVIATPVSTHVELAMSALQHGKHVLVEKPLALSSADAQRLVDEAKRRRLVLMVDHTFVYTAAVQKIRDLVQEDTLGELYYYDSVRINLGLFQTDVDVLWDLAVHDLSIMDFVTGRAPTAVSATGFAHIPGERQNIAYLTLFFDAPLIAHIHVNWLAPVKIRRTIFGGSRRMIVYDDLESSEKVKVYDRGVVAKGSEAVYADLIKYRMGDMWAPQIAPSEALHTEATHFIACIREGTQPLTDGEAGLRIVRILEAASRSMNEQGRPVEVARLQGVADGQSS
jgi:predicted dehydrogenase